MKSKQGVSAVVATVLIIMITVAAIGIIWGAVMPMVKNSIQRGDACFAAQADISVVADSGYTCINTSNDKIMVQIAKGANAKVDLIGIQMLVAEGGSTTSVLSTNLTVVSGNLPDNNEEGVLTINYTSISGITDSADEVSIAPILKVGNTEETCEISSSVQLLPCA